MIHNNVILRAKRSEDIEEISSLLTVQAKVSLTEEGANGLKSTNLRQTPKLSFLSNGGLPKKTLIDTKLQNSLWRFTCPKSSHW